MAAAPITLQAGEYEDAPASSSAVHLDAGEFEDAPAQKTYEYGASGVTGTRQSMPEGPVAGSGPLGTPTPPAAPARVLTPTPAYRAGLNNDINAQPGQPEYDALNRGIAHQQAQQFEDELGAAKDVGGVNAAETYGSGVVNSAKGTVGLVKSQGQDPAARAQMLHGLAQQVAGGGAVAFTFGAPEVLGIGRMALAGNPAAKLALAKIAGGFALGAGASKGAGAVADKYNLTPEAKELLTTTAFFVPSLLGAAAGVKSGVSTTPEGDPAVAGSAFGGRVGVGAVKTPEAYDIRAGVRGGPNVGVRIPRGGQPPAPPEPGQIAAAATQAAATEAVTQAAAVSKAAENIVNGVKPTPPPGPPLPQGMDSGQLTPQTVATMAEVIKAAPPAMQGGMMLEAHKNLATWILKTGQYVGPDGKVQVADTPQKASTLAQQVINDEIDRHTQAAEDQQKQQADAQAEQEKQAKEQQKAQEKEQKEAEKAATQTNENGLTPAEVQYQRAKTLIESSTSPAQASANIMRSLNMTRDQAQALIQRHQTEQAIGKAPDVGSKAEPTKEESRETVDAQVAALARGEIPVVMLPEGSKYRPALPPGMKVLGVKGDMPGAGLYLYDPSKVNAKTIKEAAKAGTHGDLLGHVQTKEEISDGRPTVVVQATSPTGTVLQDSQVHDDPELVRRQAEALQERHPGANIGVATPEDVLKARAEAGAKESAHGAFARFMGDVVKRHAMESQGQNILDQMDEDGESPREVNKEFWSKVYFNLPAQAQQLFQKQVKALTGMQPGDTIAIKKDGTGIVAKDWHDVADATGEGGWLPDKVEHLEGGERGYVSLMRDAIARFSASSPLRLEEGEFEDAKGEGDAVQESGARTLHGGEPGNDGAPGRGHEGVGTSDEGSQAPGARGEETKAAAESGLGANEVEQANSERKGGRGESPEQTATGGGEEATPAAQTKYRYGNTQHDIATDSDASHAIDAVRKKVAPEDLAGDGVDIDANHVTVRYGIQGDDTSGIREYLRKQAPFDAKLGKVTAFPPSENSDGAAPLIAEVHSPDLHRLNAEIAQHGDFKESDFPDYKPHATVAYVKPDAVSKYVGDNTTEGKTFRVDSVSISNRNGDKEEVKLEGGESNPVPEQDRHQLIHVARENAPAEVQEWDHDEAKKWLGGKPSLTIESAKEEDLDPKTLKTTQGWASAHKLQQWKQSGTSLESMPRIDVVRTTDGDYIVDGVHRASMAARAGQKVPATVYTVKGYERATTNEGEKQEAAPLSKGDRVSFTDRNGVEREGTIAFKGERVARIKDEQGRSYDNVPIASIGDRRPQLQPGESGPVAVSGLNLDPKRFQYKVSGIGSEGVSDLLTGKKWNEDLAGVISVWRDPADGKLYVVNGHHRVTLAKQTGAKSMLVRMLKAKDAAEARSIGALQNIADGRGTAIDAAKFLRDSGITLEDLDAKGISMGEATAQNGVALSRLDTRLFDMVVQGKMGQGRGIAIGRETGDAATQDAILSLIEKAEKRGTKVTDGTVEELARFAQTAPLRQETVASLFGDQQQTQSTALDKAQVSAYVLKELGAEQRAFGAVASEGRAQKLSAEGKNRIDAKGNAEKATAAEQAREVYLKLSARRGAIDDILNRAAEERANAKPSEVGGIDHRAYEAVRAAVSEALPGGKGARADGVQGAAGTAEREPGEHDEVNEKRTEAATNPDAGVADDGARRSDAGAPSLPGLEDAVARQADSAASLRADTQRDEVESSLTTPKADISKAAGEMERHSPLFRDTEASGQGGLFAQGGDTTYLHSGIPFPSAVLKPLSELKPVADVLALIGDEADRVAVSRDLHNRLYDMQSQDNADVLRVVQMLKAMPGTAKDQQAIYHHLEDPKANPLTAEQEDILDNYLTPLIYQAEQDFQVVTEGGVPLEDYVHRQVRDKGGMIDRIMERVKEGRQGANGVPSGRLTKTAPAAKHRTMMAATDDAGNRRVVSVKGSAVTAWTKGKPVDMGEIRPPAKGTKESYDKIVMEKLEKLASDLGISHERVEKGLGGSILGKSFTGANHIKTLVGSPEQVILHEIGHQLDERYNLKSRFVDNKSATVKTRKALAQEMRALADLRWEGQETSSYFRKYVRKGEEKVAAMFEAYLHAPEKFMQVAPATFGRFEDFLAAHPETKPILDIKPSLVLGSRTIGKEEREPDEFLDKGGKKWKLSQATTKEIEANTELRYYHNAAGSVAVNYLTMAKARRAYEFLEEFKRSPEFLENSHSLESPGAIPKGWKATQLPQFRGYFFEPHIAEVLDMYAKRAAHDPSVLEKVGNFLRTSIFFNPLIHIPNLLNHWTVEKGISGFANPLSYPTMTRAGMKAINAVIHQNQDFLDALDHGAPLQSQQFETRQFAELFFKKMQDEIGDPENSKLKEMATALGMSPVRLVQAIYKLSSKATWFTNDIAFLQATYEKQARGMSFKDALNETAKHIPDYRYMTRIFDSPHLGKLMSNRAITMFGAYHYGALKSYGQTMKSLAGFNWQDAGTKNEQGEPTNAAGRTEDEEKMHGLDVLAMMALVTFVVYPLIDHLLRMATHNDKAQMRRAGASTFVYNLAMLAKGEKTPTEVAESVATPAVGIKTAAELAFNRDLRTGQRLYNPHADWETMGGQIGRQLARSVAPVSQGMDVAEGRTDWKRLMYSMVGVSFPLHGAEKIAAQITAENLASLPVRSEKQIAHAVTRSRALHDAWSGDRSKLDALMHSPDFTPKEKAKIRKDFLTPPIVYAVKPMPYDDALRVYKAADAHQKAQLRPVLTKKLARLIEEGKKPAGESLLKDEEQ